jgi:hypothetical protein
VPRRCYVSEEREGIFRLEEAWGKVGLGHLSLLGEGRL